MTGSHGSRSRGPHQLPAGRHGLSPKFVASNQRERMMVAVAEAVSAAGFTALTVEGIVNRAGVSRRTFYDQFSNKEEAFLASYDAVATQLLVAVSEAFESSDDFSARVARCLEVFLAFMANERDFAHMCVVDVLGAGAPGIARRNGVMAAFAQLFDSAAVEAGIEVSELTSEALVGGIHEVVYSRLLSGQAETLLGLLPDLVYTALLPYVGEKAADSVRRECRHRPAARPVVAIV